MSQFSVEAMPVSAPGESTAATAKGGSPSQSTFDQHLQRAGDMSSGRGNGSPPQNSPNAETAATGTQADEPAPAQQSLPSSLDLLQLSGAIESLGLSTTTLTSQATTTDAANPTASTAAATTSGSQSPQTSNAGTTAAPTIVLIPVSLAAPPPLAPVTPVSQATGSTATSSAATPIPTAPNSGTSRWDSLLDASATQPVNNATAVQTTGASSAPAGTSSSAGRTTIASSAPGVSGATHKRTQSPDSMVPTALAAAENTVACASPTTLSTMASTTIDTALTAPDGKPAAATTPGTDQAAAATPANNAAVAASSATLSTNLTAQSSSATSPDSSSNSDQASRVRFVQRVMQAFQSLGDGSDTVRLRLSPPELGSLRLNITLRDGTMNAHIEAETPAAKNMLLDNLPALRDRLAQQNIRVERFDVDLTDQSGGGSAGQTANQFGNNRQQPQASSPRIHTASQAASAPSATSTVTTEGNRLNVVI